ncbi:MAG: hypothetical protein KKB50_20160 [Planctomycetes bacterium]|nr:hypothetical protein [Planctomycetota bacterium]
MSNGLLWHLRHSANCGCPLPRASRALEEWHVCPAQPTGHVVEWRGSEPPGG